MTSISTSGRPRHEEPEFVPGHVGIVDYSSDSILVIPGSKAFSFIDREDWDRTRRIYVITLETGEERPISARFLRAVGYVTIDSETNEARWADEAGA